MTALSLTNLPDDILRNIATRLPYTAATRLGSTTSAMHRVTRPTVARHADVLSKLFSGPRRMLASLFRARKRSENAEIVVGDPKKDLVYFKGVVSQTGFVKVLSFARWRNMKNPPKNARYLSQTYDVLSVDNRGRARGNRLWVAMWKQAVENDLVAELMRVKV